ncbi:hypothetical protein Gotri_014615, partial [Gossypium trilobum]|nr:hypothetical protein [Gossypium trilobum]
IRVNLDGLNIDDIELGELFDSDDSERLNSAHESDSDGQNWSEFNSDSDMNNPKLELIKVLAKPTKLHSAPKAPPLISADSKASRSWLLTSTKHKKATWNFPLTKAKPNCLLMRAKLKEVELLEGYHKALYEKIYEYVGDGYRASCRRIIGLDGCFLKGYFGGYLLKVVMIDVNNGIYLIAYAVVESENQASWCWFLELLKMELKIVSSFQISFMSDKQKGLVEAISMLFLNVEIRYCVKHLHANFKKVGFKTKELKYLLWKAARASNPRHFEDAMVELENTNQHTYNWLKGKNWFNSQGPTSHLGVSLTCQPIRGPKQWESMSNMLPILFPTLRKPLGRPTKVRRKQPGEPQTTTKLTKK